MLSIVGARPEFIQAAPITAALRGRCREVLVHTGQHYDDDMSRTFFRDLDLPEPDRYLGVGSGTQGEQTARVIQRVEATILQLRPDVMLLRSDTNSTLGAAVAAAKVALPVVKVEAGMRSFDRTMPEEINRIVADHLSGVLLCSTDTARRNLEREGIARPTHVVGDVLLDSIRLNLARAEAAPDTLARLGVRPGAYVLATVHRAGNTDDRDRLRAIVAGLARSRLPVVFPVHPRTRKVLDGLGVRLGDPLRPTAPVSYLDMLVLTARAAVVATDSGGVQRESYMLGRPCLTLRPNTEWVETVEAGWNVLVDADSDRIASGLAEFRPRGDRPPVFGDGHAAERVAEILLGHGS